jgi:hypothetical protein
MILYLWLRTAHWLKTEALFETGSLTHCGPPELSRCGAASLMKDGFRIRAHWTRIASRPVKSPQFKRSYF